MSRSRKKHCYTYFIVLDSQKEWKRQINREMRRGVKQLLDRKYDFEDLLFPTMDEVGNAWCSPADGTKHYAPYKVGAHWYDTYNEYYLEVLRK